MTFETTLKLILSS